MKNKKKQMLTTFIREDNDISSRRPSDFTSMLAVAAVLAVINLMSVYYYGLRALFMALITTGVCWGADIICLIMRKKNLHIHDISPIVTGLTISAMMPASVPYTVAAAAAVFAICIAKHPFGGHGYELFSCAAAGYAFAELSYPQAVLMYPKPMTMLPFDNIIDTQLYSSFTKNSMVSGTVTYSDLELMIGKFPGPMGCTFIVLIMVSVLVLICGRAVSGRFFFSELFIVLLWQLFTGGLTGVKITAVGGMLLFGIAFLSCDNSVIPKKKTERVIFGIISGLLIIAVSEISALENPVVYASLIAAPVSRLTGGVGTYLGRKKRAKSIFGAESEINETIAMIGDDADEK